MRQVTKSLVPTENKEIVMTIKKGLGLTLEQEQTLRANLPSWVPDKENVGTSMTQASTEFLVLVEEVLARDFGFSEKDIVGMEEKIKKILPVLKGMEVERELSILSPKDMAIVGDIAEKRYERLDKVDKHFFLSARRKQNLRLKGGKKSKSSS